MQSEYSTSNDSVSTIIAQGATDNPVDIISNSGITDFGPKLISILGATSGVVGFAYAFTPELISTIGSSLSTGYVYFYNYLIGSWLPAGVNLYINGILIPCVLPF